MTAITFAIITFIAVSGILVGWNVLHAYISPGEFLQSYGVDLPGTSSSSSALSQESSQSSMSASGSSLSSEDGEDSSIPPIPDLEQEIIPPIPNLSDIIDQMQSSSMSSGSSEGDTMVDLPIPDLGNIIQSSSSSEAASGAATSSVTSSEAEQSSASSQASDEISPTPSAGDTDSNTDSGGGGSTRNAQSVQDWPTPWKSITGGYNREAAPAIVPSEQQTKTISSTPTLTIEPNVAQQIPQAPVPITNPVLQMAAAPVQKPAVTQQPPAIPESIAAMIPPSAPPLKAVAPTPLYDTTAPGEYVPLSVTAPTTVLSQSAQPSPSTVPLSARVTETPTAIEETSQNVEQGKHAPLPGSGTPLTMSLFLSPLLAAGLYTLVRRYRSDASA